MHFFPSPAYGACARQSSMHRRSSSRPQQPICPRPLPATGLALYRRQTYRRYSGSVKLPSTLRTRPTQQMPLPTSIRRRWTLAAIFTVAVFLAATTLRAQDPIAAPNQPNPLDPSSDPRMRMGRFPRAQPNPPSALPATQPTSLPATTPVAAVTPRRQHAPRADGRYAAQRCPSQ